MQFPVVSVQAVPIAPVPILHADVPRSALKRNSPERGRGRTSTSCRQRLRDLGDSVPQKR